MKFLYLSAAVLTFIIFTGCSTLHERDRYLLQEHHVSPELYGRMLHGEPLSIPEIIELSKRQVPASFVVHYIWKTYEVYHLSEGDISNLKKAGVSQPVIDYLLASAPMYAPRPYPYYPPAPVAPYYGPYSYPYGYGPTVIIGGGYGYRGGYWH